MSVGHLEMRRLEQLSNTIFGVAMTLLAYQAPRDKFATGNPQWREIWHLYGGYLSALLLSFIVAGMFWYS
ncbi:TMEM175 family protein, partial [Rhodopseudomonas sp. B29]|uniref:TMEM175 family protein n=1 Tax=Rhodopseudomonas sp. B29 TaxID=95607 RepID=UPI0003B73E33